MNCKKIRLGLPKGDALKPLSKMLDQLEFPVKEYHSKNRTYRPEVEGLPVRAKIMAEKDVALQVAAGNYDIGFCGLDWAREHSIRFRSTGLYILQNLNLYKKTLFVCTGLKGSLHSIEDIKNMSNYIIIVSEYPNLAENFAIVNRLRKFKIFSVWGSAESYPPEHADVVLLASTSEVNFNSLGLKLIKKELDSELCLVVNHKSFVEKDLTPVLDYFSKLET